MSQLLESDVTVEFGLSSSFNILLTSLHTLDGVHFRWYLQDLGHPWTDWDETLGVYRVDLGIMQRHIFDFRSEVQTGSERSPYDIGIISA